MTLATPLIDFSRRIGRFEYPVDSSEARTEASRNFCTNTAALEAVWPRTVLAIPESVPELEWLYARDGSLSGRYIDGQWIGGVTVPAKAAAKMLGKVAVTGSSAVLIAPTHARQIRTVLDRMTSQQVLIVVIPSEHSAGTVLACADFSTEIRGHRLWLACGPEWAEELTAILEAQDGIAPASMMIRVPGLNVQTVERVLKPCEMILSKNNQTHRSHLALIHTKPRSPVRPPRKICVVTGPFQLWDDAAFLLARAASRTTATPVVLDASIPTQSSALRVARAADGCDAMVTANIGRADLPLVLPDNVPWITWLTTNRMIRHQPAATLDRLIVADPAQRQSAIDSGWPESSVILGQEPIRSPKISRSATPTIIADLPTVSMPRSVEEMSSQRLVWERIEHEVGQNPFCIGPKPIEYVYSVAEQIGLARTSVPIELFVTELLVPCFMRSMVAALRSREVTFRIHGRGWESLPEVANRWAGPIETESALESALASASVLIDVWPGMPTHAARRAGRPMLRPWGRDMSSLLREINRAALATTKTNELPTLDLQRVLEAL